jgi:hypothetical protein
MLLAMEEAGTIGKLIEIGRCHGMKMNMENN